MKYIIWLFFGLIFPQKLCAEYFKHLGVQEGLSHPTVFAIYQDRLGRIWFGTREGVSIYDGKQMTTYKDGLGDTSPTSKAGLSSSIVNMIAGDGDGNIFLKKGGDLIKYDIRRDSFHLVYKGKVSAITSFQGQIWCTSTDSLFVYDSQSDTLKFQIKTDLPPFTYLLITKEQIWAATDKGLYTIRGKQIECVLPDIKIFRLFESSKKELWIGTLMDGLYRMPRGSIPIKVPYDLSGQSPHCTSSNQIREFAEDKEGNIWFGTFNGLNVYQPRTNQYANHLHTSRQGTLTHSSVFALFQDKQGTIWLGTYYGGVNYFNPKMDVISYYATNEDRNDCLNYPLIGMMTEDSEGNLWIATEGGGLNFLNRQTGLFNYYKTGKANTIPHNDVKGICYDKKRDVLYIGTYTGGLSRYDKKRGTFHNYLNDLRLSDQIRPDKFINQLEFRNDRLYISARNGFFEMHPDTHTFRLINDRYYDTRFAIDTSNHAWIVWDRNIECVNLSNGNILESFPLGKLSTHVSQLTASSEGLIYIATQGNGFFAYNPKTKQLSDYTVEKDNLPSNYCCSLIETPAKNILVTTGRAVSFFSPTTKSIHSFELEPDGTISSITKECGLFISKQNEIFVSGVNGMISFREEDLKLTNDKSELYFSDLYIHNVKIRPQTAHSPLSQAFPFCKELELEAKQNNLIIYFANTNYINITKSTLYEYQLEGFDDHWIPTTQTSLYYINLPPGKYTLKVRETGNSLHNLKDNGISMNIIIHSPWYNTIWAWLIYCLLTFLVVCWIWRTKMARKLLSISLEQEIKEKQQIERLNQAKLRFFTNVSHEFRTPLTLIISQMEALLQNSLIPPTMYNQILKVEKHTQYMRNLITELLDFRKLEQDQVTLKVTEQDIVPFLEEIYQSFSEHASQRSISYTFDCPIAGSLCYFDAWQMRKAVDNLLSNAFRHTPDGGSIALQVTESDEHLQFYIVDTGTGIDAQHLDNIFELFYQVENSDEANPGTGIGLALTKDIIMLHHGELNVDSQPGKGSRFCIKLKKGKHFFEKDERVLFVKRTNSVTFNRSLPSTAVMTELQTENEPEAQESQTTLNRYTVLLVEDNTDLLHLLKSLFSPLYKILLASNGEEALTLAKSENPDLIVSDIMMPVMSGTDLCIQIKNNINLCHIPVVLLTALDSEDQHLTGLQRGADDYITKPFNTKILLTRCNNIIRNRVLMQNQFANTATPDIGLLVTNPLDKKFLEQVITIIDQNIDNTDLDIPLLCQELGVGHSLLNTKFKALTGITPNKFILSHRLKQATLMLRNQPHLQIAEIADKLGFNSPRYFSRCFKEQFNIAPLEYRRDIIKTPTE